MCINYNKFIDKTLLVIVPAYPNEDGSHIGGSFVKNQLNILKKYFNEIIVISPVLFSFKQLPKDKLCEDYSYDNIKVYYPRSFYVPIFYFRKLLVDNRLQVVNSLIQRKNINFDLIHAHFTWPSGYIGIKLKEKYHVPVVTTIHENREWFDKEIKMNNSLLTYSWKNADALIRVNNKDVPTLKNFNENSLSIPNGFSQAFGPLDQKTCRDKLNLPSDKKIIFSLGWLIERKGFNYLIDAMDNLQKQRSDTLCFIGGSGPLKNKLQKQVDDLNLTDKVKFVGFIPDELLPVWMNACDLFVLPSLSESFGVVIIEAMACGKPVIATYNGGCEEIVVSEKLGYLVEPKNPQILAKKMILSLNSNYDSKEIIEYALNFSWSKVSDSLLHLYSEFLTGKKQVLCDCYGY